MRAVFLYGLTVLCMYRVGHTSHMNFPWGGLLGDEVERIRAMAVVGSVKHGVECE